MPVGFNSPARNLFLLGSTGAQLVTNFFKTISQTGTDGVYQPSGIRYNVPDQKYILSGSASDSQSKDFGWIEKRTEAGTADWQVKIQSTFATADTTLKAFEIDNNDNLIVAGKTDVYPWIAKYTNGGVLSWQVTTETNNIEYTGIAIDSSNNIYACGNTPTPSNQSTAFIEKFNTSGTPGWSVSSSLIGRDVILTKCAVNSRGEVVAVGIIEDDSAFKGYVVKVNANTGEILWDRTIRSYEPDIALGYEPVFCEDVYIDGNDQIYIVGRLFGISETRSFIIKYSPEGNMLWQKETPPGETIQHYHVRSDTETEQTIVFSQYFGLGGMISKYSKNGDLVFRRVIYSSFNSSTAFGPKGLDADPSNYYLLFVDDPIDLLAGDPKRYTFGKVSSSGNGLGNFTYSEGTGQTIYYQSSTIQDKIGRLSDGSVRQDTSDLLAYPFNANKIMFDDLATQVANKKVQVDEQYTFSYGSITTPTIEYPYISKDAIVYGSNLILNYDFANKATYSGTGTSVNNLSSTSYPGSINGATFNSAGYFVFDNANNDEIISSTTTIGDTGAPGLTVEIWMNLSSSTVIGSGGTSWIFGEEGRYRLLYNAAGNITFVCATTNNGWYTTGTVLSIGGSVIDSWKHVVGTYNGTNLRLYTNGSLSDTSTNTISGNVISTGDPVMSLMGTDAGNVGWGTGNIGEVRIYNRALTASEVSQNFNATRAKYGV